MKVLSVDPGYERLGVAVLEKSDGGKEVLLHSDCFKTSAKLPFHERLKLIGDEILRLTESYKTDALAIEKLFFNTNQKTAMAVSEVRGAIIYIALSNGLDVYEYTPPQIKAAVTGSGAADKKQVMQMVPNLIKINKEIAHDDEWDAVAIGLTHLACVKENVTIA